MIFAWWVTKKKSKSLNLLEVQLYLDIKLSYSLGKVFNQPTKKRVFFSFHFFNSSCHYYYT